jgi:peroxiredoxin (alkyl hydroperoxide reductase subunit C)
MKKTTFLLTLICSITLFTWAQSESMIPLIGEEAPSFTAKSTNGQITFPDDYGKNWKILFSHPRDFTPVCSTEILELASMQSEFKKLNVELVVLSTDKLTAHHDWKAALELIDYKGAGTQKINFPLVTDESLTVSNLYGMLHTSASPDRDVRGVFIINPDNVVESVSFYPMDIGRNIDEIKRLVMALQQTKMHEETATPANWNPEDDLLVKYLDEDAKEELNMPSSSLYQIAWFMTFKKSE